MKNNIIEEIAKENKIYMLQNKYENGIINLEDISDDESSELVKLYQKQIETLKDNIDMRKKELKTYKEKILKLKNS